MAQYHPVNYSRRFARPIKLADGTRLFTLKDAADLLTGERFVVNRPTFRPPAS